MTKNQLEKDFYHSLHGEDLSILDEYSKDEVRQQLEDIKDEALSSEYPAIACQSKPNNPNYFAIVEVNEAFCKSFKVEKASILGKNYDFLFDDIDLEHSSESQIELFRLLKDVKDFHQCSVIIDIDYNDKQQKYKIDFHPEKLAKNSKIRHAVLTFEAIKRSNAIKNYPNYNNERSNSDSKSIVLERALRHERLLRHVSSFLISDLSIRQTAKKIAKSLCEHLKIDRIIIHDYKNSQTSFIIEHHIDGVKPIFEGANDTKALADLATYINFHNNFYQKKGNNKDQKNSILIMDDIKNDPTFNSIKNICEKYSISSQIAVTTTFNAKVNGGIYIHQFNNRNWLADEVELIEMVAEQYSIALDRSESIEKVMLSNHALTEKTLELKKALKKEQEIRKMQSEFVALVSHEFKTPLQIIDGTRELLHRKILGLKIEDEVVEKSFAKIKSGIQRMNGLINSTLNLAKMESTGGKISIEAEIFDLKKFTNDIIEKNLNLAQIRNIKLLKKIDTLPTDFNADPKLIEHSLNNVISNAIKYSKADSVIKIIAKSNSQKIAIRVIDQGIGIPKEDLIHIGDKFYRAKNTLSVSGTGIGLYLSRYFIELHGGNLKIDSRVDVGTTVTITLPIQDPKK